MGETFGEGLRRARECLGWEREQVEEQAGLPSNAMALLEEGGAGPSDDDWRRLVDLLQIDPDTKRAMDLARIEWTEARKPPEQRGRPLHPEGGPPPLPRRTPPLEEFDESALEAFLCEHSHLLSDDDIARLRDAGWDIPARTPPGDD
jgi:transcriptional regulator with XRE-family HTH domain